MVGLIEDNNEELLAVWTKKGWFLFDGVEDAADLVNVSQRHKHADVIIAWANGAKIECAEEDSDDWMCARWPRWRNDFKYRVKPV